MILGFKIGRLDAEFAISKQIDNLDEDGMIIDHNLCEEPIEKLAKDNNAEYVMLGFEDIVFSVGTIRSLNVKELPKQLIKYRKALSKLEKSLKLAGLDVEEAELFDEPEWTRHGECINYN